MHGLWSFVYHMNYFKSIYNCFLSVFWVYLHCKHLYDVGFTSFVVGFVYGYVLFFVFFSYGAVLRHVWCEVLNCEYLTRVAVLRCAGRHGASILVPVLVPWRVFEYGLRLLDHRWRLGQLVVLQQNRIIKFCIHSNSSE